MLVNAFRRYTVARALSLGCGFMSSAPRAVAATAAAWSASSIVEHHVYLDHDGGNDDFVALVYLLKHEPR